MKVHQKPVWWHQKKAPLADAQDLAQEQAEVAPAIVLKECWSHSMVVVTSFCDWTSRTMESFDCLFPYGRIEIRSQV